MTKNERIEMMGCQIDKLTMEETLQTIEGFIKTGHPHQHGCLLEVSV